MKENPQNFQQRQAVQNHNKTRIKNSDKRGHRCAGSSRALMAGRGGGRGGNSGTRGSKFTIK
jgi:hypothetical protein